MILKSYIVEKDIGILEQYHATLVYGENEGIKTDIKAINIHNVISASLLKFLYTSPKISDLSFKKDISLRKLGRITLVSPNIPFITLIASSQSPALKKIQEIFIKLKVTNQANSLFKLIPVLHQIL